MVVDYGMEITTYKIVDLEEKDKCINIKSVYVHDNCNKIDINKCFDELTTKFDTEFILFSVELINDNLLSIKDDFGTRFYTSKPINTHCANLK